MRDIESLLDRLDKFSTVIVAGNSIADRRDLLDRLTESHINVIGPVDTAGKALALAAHSPIDAAIVEPQLAGRRSGHELAESLKAAWGVPTLILTPDAG